MGRGLVGSAAARHLAERGRRVALVGAGEPSSYASSSGPFASHFDEGRITRVGALDPVWSELAARSIRRYDNIAERSGIAFHGPCGNAFVSSQAQACIDNANEHGSQARLVTRQWLRDHTGINISADREGEIAFEPAPAGYINPRRLVAAQTRLATCADATLIDSSVNAISAVDEGSMVLDTTAGPVRAQRVLLTTGAYGATLVGVDLETERHLETVLMVEFDDDVDTSSLILEDPHRPGLDRIYWVPPVRYPDGRTMLKIGRDSSPPNRATCDSDINDWFQRGGDPDHAESLMPALRSMLPQAAVGSWDHKPCIVTHTPTGWPYIGWVQPDVAVAVAGNGSGAKSSDEIGRLAADLVEPRQWTDAILGAHQFTPRTRTNPTP